MSQDNLVPIVGDDGLEMNEGQRGGAPNPGEGAPPQQSQQAEIINALNSTFVDLRTAMPSLTPEFMNSSDKATLKTKRLELETLVSVYEKEFPDLNLELQTPENGELWKKQLQQVKDWKTKITKFFDDVKAMEQLGLDNEDVEVMVSSKYKEGDDTLKLAEELLREREKHAEQIGKLQEQIDRLNANYERERRSAGMRILSLEEQLLQKQPDELSYDEVDNDDQELGAQQQGTQKEQATMNLKLDTF